MSLTDFNDLHVELAGRVGSREALRRLGDSVLASIDAASKQRAERLKHPIETPETLAQHDFGEPPKALPEAEEAYTPPPASGEWRHMLITSDKGVVKGLAANVETVLNCSEAWRDSIRWCDFTSDIVKHRAPVSGVDAGVWVDGDTSHLRVWLNHEFEIGFSEREVIDGLFVSAKSRRFHPVQTYLKNLEWDGVPRLDSWLVRAFNAQAESPEYLRLVGRMWLIGAVNRIMRPGCKMDNVLILEGEQGIKKSTSLAALFGEWFSDADLPIGDKDSYLLMRGAWCIELAELDSFNKTEITTLKRFFSQQHDKYRAPYGKKVEDHPRQCVFFGTTNQHEYLRDPTGERRYWPVMCLRVDMDWIRENRDQIWAEAMVSFVSGERYWIEDVEDKKLFDKEVELRQRVDPWVYIVEDWLRGDEFLGDVNRKNQFVSSDEILTGALKIDPGRIQPAQTTRLTDVMRFLGWVRSRGRVRSGAKTVQRRGYVPPSDWESRAEEAFDDGRPEF